MKKTTLISLFSFFALLMSCTQPKTIQSYPDRCEPLSWSSGKTQVSEKSYNYSSMYDSFSAGYDIFYWKEPSGALMCFPKVYSNMLGTYDVVKKLIEENSRPIELMGKIINEKYTNSPDAKKGIDVYEINCPFLEDEYYDIAANYHNVCTLNKDVYALLSLEESYEHHCGKDERAYFRHEYFFCNETKASFRVSIKYFTNLSHIFRWKDADGATRFGIIPEANGEIGGYKSLMAAQSYYSFDASEIKRIVEAYYSITDIGQNNLVIDTPLIELPRDWEKGVVEAYPDNIVDDLDLYKELGLEASYHSYFGK